MDAPIAVSLLVHFAATWFLVGLCWLVQRVQYPLMAQVGSDAFVLFEQAHVRQIGAVVAPAMLIELATGVGLWLLGGATFRQPLFVCGLALIGVIWLSTFLVQVPLHDRLGRGFDGEIHASLVRTNWVRTLAWSARGLILCWLLWAHVPGRVPA